MKFCLSIYKYLNYFTLTDNRSLIKGVNLKNIITFLTILLIFALSFYSQKTFSMEQNMDNDKKTETITLGSGCFWCTEAVFQNLKGIVSSVSGYSGGSIPNPTYEDVCSGTTNYAEVIQVTYNPEIISLAEILEVFWRTHDPTTLNRQGNDIGTQYRSVIFYHNEKQKQIAEDLKEKLERAKIYDAPIVTEISPLKNFYKAEKYHQNYYEQNKDKPYCNFVITPKIEKFKKIFKDKLKHK